MNKFVAFAACLLVLGASAHNGSALLSHGAVADTDSDSVATSRIPESSVVDEVIWVVGDEPILKSDVEAMRLQSEAEGVKWHGNPDCAIPEQLAIQKLFLHQAALDSIEVTESEVSQSINEQLDYLTQMIGSQEKLEEYYKKSLSQMRDEMHDDFKNRLLIQRMKEKLVEEVKVSPADVKAYFRNMPQDSIPLVPTEVEVEILVNTPKVPQAEINKVKDDLRSYTDRINKGETTFSTMARFYSEDTNSARHGGELGYVSRAMLDPALPRWHSALPTRRRFPRLWRANSDTTSSSLSTSVAMKSMCATSCVSLWCPRKKSTSRCFGSIPSAATSLPTSLPLNRLPLCCRMIRIRR